MLNVSEELKNLYRLEYTNKELVLYFPTINKTITNDGIVMESMKLTESICEEEELTFGGCNSAMFEISIFNVTENLQGQKMVVTQKVYTEDGTSFLTMPLGTYYVDTLKKQTNGMYTDLVSYDRMKDTDTDVSAWYNGLVFPITIKSMRESLYTFLGLSYEVQTLPLDNISISKTINPSYLKARDVLYAISEANATFGKITREDKIKHIGLGGIGLYPSETLYPSEDLFPSESTETQTNARLYDAWYEDYIVESIDSISITYSDGVVGVTVGDTTNNPYVINGNFIFYGMDNATLTTVANLLLLSIKNKFYRPAELTMVGLPYLEVGDTIATINDETTIETFMFERVLSGIQALSDNVIAKGNAKRENNVDINTQIEQLNGKTLKLTKSVDGVSVELSDLASDTTEKFEIANGQILLKVDSSGKVVSVALGADADTGSLLEIKADNINLEGLVSVNGNFKVLLDGSIEAVNAKFSGTVTGTNISGSVFTSTYNDAGNILTLMLGANNAVGLECNITNGGSNIVSTTYGYYGMSGSRQRYSANYKLDKMELTDSDTGRTILIKADDISNGGGITGLQETSNGNPYLNAKAIGTTQWVLDNFHKIGSTYTSSILWTDNGNNNCVFGGTSLYGASTSWVLANFEQKACDERLKEDIVDMKEITNVYMAFQSKEWFPKEKTIYRKKIHQTLTAQGVMKAFEENGLDWTKYDIIEEKKISDTDFCGDIAEYTDGENYFVINDKNLHAYHISFNQSLYRKVQAQEETIQSQAEKIDSLQNRLDTLEELLQAKGVI